VNDPQQPGPPRAPSVAVFSPGAVSRPSALGAPAATSGLPHAAPQAGSSPTAAMPSMPPAAAYASSSATPSMPPAAAPSQSPAAELLPVPPAAVSQPPASPVAAGGPVAPGAVFSFAALIDALAPESADELYRVAGPAVSVTTGGVGGRTAIGAPVTVLHRSGIATGLVLGGIPYALSILRSMHSEWSFVPARGTELVRLSVIERVAYRRALPALLAGLGVGLSIVLGGMLFGALLGAVSVSLLALVPLVFFFSVVTAWLLGNYVVLRGLRALGTELFATTVRIEHGFPAKTPLLEVAVQGSAQPVLTSVEPLLEKLGAVTPWRHVHMPGGGTPALLVQRDGEARR